MLAIMIERADPEAIAQALHRELDAVRVRLAQSRETSRGGRAALMVFALSEEVERLCREAAVCSDKHRSNELLANARAQLDELQKLLGVH